MSRLVSDTTWAILTIYGEARGESRDGKIGVAEVIRNRTRKRYQSSGTVASTCLQPYQFSMWNTGDPNRRLAALADDTDGVVLACLEAWAAAQAGSDLTHGAVLYLNPHIVTNLPPWVHEAEQVAEIGSHTFYVPR